MVPRIGNPCTLGELTSQWFLGQADGHWPTPGQMHLWRPLSVGARQLPQLLDRDSRTIKLGKAKSLEVLVISATEV